MVATEKRTETTFTDAYGNNVKKFGTWQEAYRYAIEWVRSGKLSQTVNGSEVAFMFFKEGRLSWGWGSPVG